VTELLRLTDLSDAAGLGRYARIIMWRQLLFWACIAMREAATALPRDIAQALRRPSAPRLRLEAGIRPDASATRIALYVHYSASGRISEMVRGQLDELRRLGYSIVFVSMADRIPDDDWQAVRSLAALVAQRSNFGLDFGAWRDLLPEVCRRWPVIDELLLANDSILGPIHPLAPAIDTMRAAGPGLFGMTESLQGSPHLQSYMLLARGVPVVEDLIYFVRTLYVSSSKWILVRMGEIRLSRWMRRRGHRVAALFGYERLVQAAVADPRERQRLKLVYKRLGNLDELSDDDMVAILRRWPLNPTHHLWRVLATQFHCPFLKTELIVRNPAGLPGVAHWGAAVPDDSPCSVPVILAHLATLAAD
jgi:Rhamnan synthesis protein F